MYNLLFFLREMTATNKKEVLIHMNQHFFKLCFNIFLCLLNNELLSVLDVDTLHGVHNLATREIVDGSILDG